MALVVPVKESTEVVTSGGSSSWKPSDVKEIITGIRSMINEAKGLNNQQRKPNNTQEELSSTPPGQHECRVEQALTGIYLMLDKVCASGMGDAKVLELLQKENPTIATLKNLLGKALGK